MYDSMAEEGHREANTKLKSSVEEMLNEEKQQEWRLEQIPVLPQTDGESCGYKMLYNVNKLCNDQELEIIEEEETALEGYIIEAIMMLKGNQQNTMRREEGQGDKRARREKSQEKETEKVKTIEDTRMIETRQELRRREQSMNAKIIERQKEITEKMEKRKGGKEENGSRKKQRKVVAEKEIDRRQLKRTRQQQKQENEAEEQDYSKLRSWKLRKNNPVERSLSRRCLDAPD